MTAFLVVPTITVVIGAFQDADGGFSFEKIEALGGETALRALWQSVLLSASSAAIGAVLGALLTYLVISSPPASLARRVITSICSVLAQFGGVTLAFAWMATLGFGGLLTKLLADVLGMDATGSGWLYDLPGLILVYTYFQIPLMVIVFLPALEGLRPQWREAAVNLGASTWQYWTPGRLPAAAPGVPRLGAAAVRQRVRGVRHRGGPGQPGRADHAAADPLRADQRGRARPGRTSPSRWRCEMVLVVVVVMVALRPAAAAHLEVAAMTALARARSPGCAAVLSLAFARLLPAAAGGAARLQHQGRGGGRTGEAWTGPAGRPDDVPGDRHRRWCWPCSPWS